MAARSLAPAGAGGVDRATERMDAIQLRVTTSTRVKIYCVQILRFSSSRERDVKIL